MDNDTVDHSVPVPIKHRRPVVVLLVFCVLGPLGLRLLWDSPMFKLPEKVALSVLSVIELALIAYLMSQSYTSYLLSIGADGPT